jgi:hypothetical protein
VGSIDRYCNQFVPEACPERDLWDGGAKTVDKRRAFGGHKMWWSGHSVPELTKSDLQDPRGACKMS